ncbi:ATPase family AAA domain-containing protein 5-like isoform X2 [Salmo salar]|uniref:ATPase family AAA domain-containing protein 5-like isoform X2 n=1 Tax=Salmo salar TaxID=8030 RepID=A0A1S3PTH6_SALSA|nr:ATPase family AAA domain-containing protein 5-like isoform X2 [Salmo salar]|eukprot:XP_014031003.1 PREDICTED: ATPase family AAA domain-containing protein 5-like isoform X2 [Salmo salar]
MGRVMEKLTLPVAPPRRGFNVSQTTSCDPSSSSSMVDRRYDVIRTVLSSRAFCTLGNKQAVAVDYLPVLRSMCQSERTQEQGQGRFLHYLSSIHLGLPKATDSLQMISHDHLSQQDLQQFWLYTALQGG